MKLRWELDWLAVQETEHMLQGTVSWQTPASQERSITEIFVKQASEKRAEASRCRGKSPNDLNLDRLSVPVSLVFRPATISIPRENHGLLLGFYHSTLDLIWWR